MEEQYVTLETAKSLEKVGFDVPCLTFYRFDPERNEECLITTNVKTDHNAGEPYFYSFPTQALAARWLREKYNLHIVSFYDYSAQMWFYVISDLTDIDYYGNIISDSKYSNYEDALEAGLQETIEMIETYHLRHE